MDITEAKIKLVSDTASKLKAFCSLTIDGEFVIRDIKVIEGSSGYFVAMPSRKLTDHCPKCRAKNHLRASYCNECGGSLRPNRMSHDEHGRAKLHVDIAHPINAACRGRIQTCVVEAYKKELAVSTQPGYKSASDADDSAEPEPDADSESGVTAPAESAVVSPPQAGSTGEADGFSRGIC